MRLITKEQRLAYRAAIIPEGAIKVRSKNSEVEVYLYTSVHHDSPCALTFIGSAAKPAQRYRYKNEAERAKAVGEWIANQDERDSITRARAAERKAEDRGLEVGDVLISIWGYDQTNIDYYQVTALVGERMVEIREIDALSETTGWLQGTSVPAVGKFIGPAMRKVAKSGSVKVRSFSWASKMGVKGGIAGTKAFAPSHWTAYA